MDPLRVIQRSKVSMRSEGNRGWAVELAELVYAVYAMIGLSLSSRVVSSLDTHTEISDDLAIVKVIRDTARVITHFRTVLDTFRTFRLSWTSASLSYPYVNPSK